ncbi:hypothetical protein BO94DRAFT_514805 [Aspergillus sclerotioniger CBS 115572]|uniref:Uncharacterized protein n=1 Tax=Aspergillus sclerotioniger CBS 115572 TaxID=1450535 RepID=A0A317WTM4_9EURO|nr:hypothetical protein BO94DRAFT_514805 [Aspergillus sclerotioniger CBS 115572]PWY89445.1 hypothetical protein BO94DRAFT_514805 [Aspergillus sclerotioniger CBS 115572]
MQEPQVGRWHESPNGQVRLRRFPSTRWPRGSSRQGSAHLNSLRTLFEASNKSRS